MYDGNYYLLARYFKQSFLTRNYNDRDILSSYRTVRYVYIIMNKSLCLDCTPRADLSNIQLIYVPCVN